MKEELRFGGILASAAFMLITLNGYVATMNPLHSLLYGVGASLTLGYIGYKMAYILTHPQGRRKRKNAAKSPASTPEEPLVPMTGEESLLDDL